MMTFEFSGPNLNVNGNMIAYVPAAPIPTKPEISVNIKF